MNHEMVKITKHEFNIVEISLNRPQALNALNQELLTQLNNLFTEIKFDKNIRAVLLTGVGKGFCAGADIKELAPLNGATALQFARFGQAVCRQLETLGKPSLAAIQGFAFGGGCELAMSATLRIASSEAVFAQPEIKLGVIPGFGGTQRLARLVGKGRALDLCLSGRRFNASEALNWGLVTAITPKEELLAKAISILKELTSFSSIALANIITSINLGYDLPMEEALELEANQFALCCTTADKQEGVTAFLEKRQAVFSGE